MSLALDNIMHLFVCLFCIEDSLQVKEGILQFAKSLLENCVGFLCSISTAAQDGVISIETGVTVRYKDEILLK